MIHWSEPTAYTVGRGTITMRKAMYMGISVIHECTCTTPGASVRNNVSDKFYPEYHRIKSGLPRRPHFISERELMTAIHDYHRNAGRAMWPGGITTLRAR